MKIKLLMLMLAVCWSTQQTIAQDDEMDIAIYEMPEQEMAPDVVVATMTRMYPNAEDVMWMSDMDDPSIWLVDFVDEGMMVTARYDNKGNWIWSAIDMGEEQLPQTIRQKLDEVWDEYEMTIIKQIKDSKGERYDIGVYIPADELNYSVLIDGQGKVTKKLLDDSMEE